MGHQACKKRDARRKSEKKRGKESRSREKGRVGDQKKKASIGRRRDGEGGWESFGSKQQEESKKLQR